MWDIGGQQAIRPYWENYYNNNDGIIYVVDSSDEERLGECTDELTTLLKNDKLAKAPLLVFANKQDLDLALDAEEVLKKMELEGISERHWHIQACSALTKEGKWQSNQDFISRY